MARCWQPQEDSLRQLMQLLKDSQSPDNATQISVQQELKKYPDFSNYLMHLLTQLTLDDPSIHEGALGIILKICEDSSKDKLDEPLISALMPKCIEFFQHSSSKTRSLALACVREFIKKEAQALVIHTIGILQGLMHLAAGDDAEIRAKVCCVFTKLIDTRMDLLVPHMEDIIECILGCSQDSNDTVALEACKFWWSLSSEQAICRPVLVNRHLVRLVLILLKWMRLSDSDLVLLKIDVDRTFQITDNMQDEEESAGKGDDDSEYGVDTYGALPDNNLRKISAQTLDVLSKGFEDELLPILLPTLKETLYHPEWRIMESGILALASIAEGCKKGMADHLAELFPLLISCLLEKRAIVRTITRWTLCGCYAPLMLGQPHDQYIKPLITELLKRIGTEGNERVQAAACIALETLQEEAGTQLDPYYLSEISKTLVPANGKYHHRAIETMAGSVGSQLNQSSNITVSTPPNSSHRPAPLSPSKSASTSNTQTFGATVGRFLVAGLNQLIRLNPFEKIKKWKKEGKAKSAIDEALLGLDRAKEMLLERRAYLESNIAAQREIAKVMFSSNNKPGAKGALKIMPCCKNELKNIAETQIPELDMKKEALGRMKIQSIFNNSIKSANKVLFKAANPEQLGFEHLEPMTNENNKGSILEPISNQVAFGNISFDDEDYARELEELMVHEERPSTNISSAPSDHSSLGLGIEDDDDMEELAAWASSIFSH